MAEEYLQFLEATSSAKSFDEFEQIWMKMGDELEMEGLAKRPSTPTPESKKNQKAETDSTSHVPFEGYSPAHDSNSLSNWSECQFNAKVEDSILTNLRRTNPGKIRVSASTALPSERETSQTTAAVLPTRGRTS
uniref:Uncharacterized protein n=1 Tax=Magallana gigas TaxID=29159 RepID=A0A8W8MJK9_MAGGI